MRQAIDELDEPDTFPTGWEKETVRNGAAPLVAVVQGSAPFVARCRNAAAAAGAVVLSVDLDALELSCHARKPRVVLVTRLVYAFDEEGFLSLAREVDARLLRVPHENVDASVLAKQLQRALA
jgi:hypothetical protein